MSDKKSKQCGQQKGKERAVDEKRVGREPIGRTDGHENGRCERIRDEALAQKVHRKKGRDRKKKRSRTQLPRGIAPGRDNTGQKIMEERWVDHTRPLSALPSH